MNKRVLFTKMVFIAVVSGIVLFQGCVANDANRIKAQKFVEEKDFAAAVEHYNKALQKHPDDLDLRLRLKDVKQKASLQHMRKAQELISKKYFREAIEELQVSIAFYSSNHRAIELVDKVKMMKESFYYTKKGNKQIKTGNFENARKSFQRALDLDPENQEAKIVLDKFKKNQEDLPEYRLDLRSNAPISLKFKKTPMLNVFEILSKLTGINFIFDKDIKESKVTLFMTDVKFDRFLDVLLKTNSLKAKMINQRTMLIYPDTPAKAKEYDDLYVKTFYLSYLKAKNAVAILTKILKTKNIIANEKLNAVTVRGQKENVAMAARIIEANDRIPAEVVLNVEIMEVSRKKEKDLGLSISDTITFGVSETSSGIDFNTDFGFAGMASIKDISKITSNELYLSLPTATLKLLKKDGDTRILAKPQIRVSSSEKASILIGEKVPLRSNRKVQTDGTTTYDFLYQDVGVKLTAEPVINMYDQVTLTLGIEISALGSNVGTVTDPQFSIKTRTTNTVLTISDGDSVIIGGLIEDEDRTTIQKIPWIGEVPVLGKLFSNENSEVVKTDILMTITPVIIRNQDIPEANISGFWSGNEKQVSLELPAEEKIIKETDFNDFPDEDYIMVIAEEQFLPSDNYFSIQVYSSKDEADAQKRSKELKAMEYKTWIRPFEIKDKGTFYRLFVGQYGSYQKTEEILQDMLKEKIFPKDIHIVDRAYVYGK
ncbi:MAG: tetratricopeptide repeat protein [Desulfobacula sp.]|uniref:tetratricopeptide repeat protein n=1 Tax=Desulfobacula sp. TaxID=2593537 RepID=UPI0025B9901A|nr:tetratricopeptide repeat protein [Desulfobacula sp.]MCD4721224.1 tetratricopeptide repeat protein [Desulfobacula sp.]